MPKNKLKLVKVFFKKLTLEDLQHYFDCADSDLERNDIANLLWKLYSHTGGY